MTPAEELALRQSEESRRRGIESRRAYQEFNPPIERQRGLSFQRPYQDAVSGMTGDLSSLAERTGFRGDLADFIAPATNRMMGNRLGQELGSQNAAFGANRATQLKRTLGGFDKGNQLMDWTQQLGQLPGRAGLSWAEMQDEIARMRRSHQAPLNPWSAVTGSLGKVLGRYASTRLSRKPPIEDIDPYELPLPDEWEDLGLPPEY